ncbi:CHAP domain-containing protein [Mumia sp. DW29H23]|uniref:CHAP domain-containing protein n=1 Tax=Mumia sp. DW29H23 TaxID=3421241 RepID=UPI003D68B5EE
MSGSARKLLNWAAEQVRTLERPEGSNKNPYADIAGHANGQPWCATFIVAGLKKNDIPLVDGTNSAFTPTMQKGFKQAGRLHDRPRAGDVGFVFYPELGRIGHVFFVEKVDGDFVKTIEGNTNLDGSRTGIGVFRHRRRWRGTDRIRGFGRPRYAADGTSDTGRAGGGGTGVPVVHVKALERAAKHDAPGREGATIHPRQVRIVEAALLAEGLLSARFAKDGSFGTKTIRAYSQWQKRLGFTGDDANGIPGLDSLRELGRRHGFKARP